jgi:hypothetical protein
MMIRKQCAVFLPFLLLFLFSENLNAQLKVYGTVYSEGPVRASVDVEGEPDTYFLYLKPKKDVEWNGQMVKQTKYQLPWEVKKNVNHTIKFTDGTVEKTVFIHGPVPEEISPKQKFIIDIDLTNPDNADVMLVVFWSTIDKAYLALPLTELEKIKEHSYEPSFWE